ncbi:glycerol-3-phosphate dehydrogenase subunit GlpB [Chloroflexus sp.]|uniref:glycerol-3-phosphate dehydrogenase subunit GlpB n=1 Tax=Chloroflexus sp. TaxID=1904827 RepID=UPI00260EEC75|nr:glycerol-3-phosphate dehydrogenase subunit GlpB [uncultured Chloroflexus sp.]
MYDTIVIGAGLSGMMAAIGRAERGEKVLVLAKGYGATHWSTGCIDLLAGCDDPFHGITQLAAQRPHHPYALAGPTMIEGGIARLRAICEAAGYPLVGNLNRHMLLPTALGALRPTTFAPVTMIAGDARQLRDGRPTLIAGFAELRDFFPPLIAANLRAQGIAATAAQLAMPPVGRQRDFSPATLARLCEQPAFRASLGEQLAALARQGDYARIGLPAILGLKHATEVVRDLQNRAGALVFEIPTLPVSVPGMRLYQILEDEFLRLGGRIQLGGFVQRGESISDTLVAVFSEAAAREQRHAARRWVLATGGILGGGARATPEGYVRETALDLPLQAPAGRAGWFAPRFLNEEGHPIFQSGVRVDERLRPLDAAGRLVYDNVMVVGGALAGFDPIREGCLEGAAIATGWMAGMS